MVSEVGHDFKERDIYSRMYVYMYIYMYMYIKTHWVGDDVRGVLWCQSWVMIS